MNRFVGHINYKN